MAKAPFVIQPQLTAITVAYKNGRMIADSVMPRVPVNRAEFKYTVYSLGDTFTIPDTKVGRTSKPNEVDWSATEKTDSVRDYGLEQPVPNEDIENAQGTTIDPRGRATEQLSDLMLLDREKRVSDLLQNPATFAANNKTTLTALQQWSNFDSTDSNPIRDILEAMDKMIVRPNVLVLGRAVFTKLAQHPRMVKAFFGNSGDSGVVTREFMAQLFELDEVIVGEGWYNMAKKGQNVSLARLWGKNAILMYRNPLTASTKDMTFAITAQQGERVAGTIQDPDIGLKGGERIRVGEQVKELVIANDLAYFFQNAVA